MKAPRGFVTGYVVEHASRRSFAGPVFRGPREQCIEAFKLLHPGWKITRIMPWWGACRYDAARLIALIKSGRRFGCCMAADACETPEMVRN